MPRYIEVVNATHETATKILALREGGKARTIVVTTDGGATASVSHNDRSPNVTLNMPTLPPDSVMTRAEADRLVAFIAHECCHVLHTSTKAWKAACDAGDRVRLWTNCLEDVRIEQREIKAGIFPALRSVLSTMANHLHMKAVPEMAAKGILIGARVVDAPFVAAVLGRMDNGYAIPAAHSLRADMSPAVAKLVNHALAGIRRCRTTEAVRLLALELVRMERQQPQGSQPQPQPRQDKGQDGQGASSEAQDGQDGQGASGEAQDSQDGQDGQGASGEAQDGQDGQDGQGASGEAQDGQDGQGASGEAQDGQDGQGASGEAQDGQDGQGASGEAQDGQDGQGASGGDGSGVPALSGDGDLTDTVAKVADRAGVGTPYHYRTTSRAHALTVARSSVTDSGFSYGNAGAGVLLDQRLPRNSVLHGQIGRLLVSEEVHRRTHHESSGRLDRRALVRMRAGAVDVYSRRDDTPGMDTALLVLIDGSSSMDAMVSTGNNRMAIAQTAAWHIARAAEAANAKVAVAVFHTSPEGIALRQRGGLGVMTGAQLTVVKPWSIPVADRAGVLARIEPNAWTPLSPAIMTAAGMLADVPATRHILMVLTDGECDYGNDGVQAACRLAGDVGVETVGVGMACRDVIDAFPPRYSVNVQDLTQLATTGLGVLVAMLEDANPRGGDD